MRAALHPLRANLEAIELILTAIEKAGYKPGEDIAIVIDPAVSEIYEDDGTYLPRREAKIDLCGAGRPVGQLVAQYPIISIKTVLRRMTGPAGN